MPLEVKLCAVPRLKALNNRKNISGWQERGSTSVYQTTQLKIPILLHMEPRGCLIMACSVSENQIRLVLNELNQNFRIHSPFAHEKFCITYISFLV